MSTATVQGREVGLDEAIVAAAGVLDRSRRAAIAGLDADIAAVEAAVRLARRVDGVADHYAARVVLRDLDVMRTVGWVTTTPLQARARADVVVLLGEGLEQDWAGMEARLLLERAPPLFPERARRVIRICPGAGANSGEIFRGEAGGAASVAGFLGQVRAALGGRAGAGEAARRCAEALASASYGVVVWSASRIDGLTVETACGLVDELNARTRFAGLPIPAPGNAAGAAQASAWLTGYPLPVGFEGGVASHDPWRFDAQRLVESGEADAALWLSCGAVAVPDWGSRLPLVALCAEGTAFPTPPEVAISVGRAGLDHDGVLYDADLGGLAFKEASARSDAAVASDVLSRIAALVGDRSC